MQWVVRFLLGAVIVSVFALIGDVLRPKGFAGLFGAAPSVALATLSLTLFSDGRQYAALEARSMIVGALAFFLYALGCVYLMAMQHRRATSTTLALLVVWGAGAWAGWSFFLEGAA
jgi:hypothetical protein